MDMNVIIGKTPVQIEVGKWSDGYDESDQILMRFSDGSECRWYHQQDCCESVNIDDINGDFTDLIGNPLLVAEERTQEREVEEYDHETWTFYTFRGVGGSVDVKWYGTSNGYYSEGVNFHYTDNAGKS